MRRRSLYLLLFGPPALLASLALGLVVLAFAVSFFWLFVFGDDTWPGYASVLLGAIFVGTSGATWIALLYFSYAEGRRQEAKPSLDRRHLAYSLGATILLLALPVLYGMFGNFGDSSPSRVCAGYCRDKGFAASGLPPADFGAGVCTCYDQQGKAAASISMTQIAGKAR